MKRFLIILMASLLMSAPALTALRFGLGNAVAHRSADLINQASNSLVGYQAAQSLPACGADPIYTVAPVDPIMLTGMVPIGNLAPSGHTFPSDHAYVYMNPGTYTLYSPGNVTITDIKTTTYLGANPVHSDYAITIYACRDVQTYFAHVKSLSAYVMAQMSQFTSQSCTSYSTGGSSIQSCDLYTNIPVTAGTALGIVSGFDFGTYDDRVAPLAFVSPSRHFGSTLNTACPLNYFIPSLANAFKAKLGLFNDAVLYDGMTPCGTILYDVTGTAAGDWFKPGQPDNPEDPHLALVHDNVRTTWEAFSVGTSGPGPVGVKEFIPNGVGLVNRDFAQINDNQIYCYETFRDVFTGNPIGNAIIYLVQLTSPTTLKLDQQSSANCAAAGPPWAFSGAAVDYQR